NLSQAVEPYRVAAPQYRNRDRPPGVYDRRRQRPALLPEPRPLPGLSPAVRPGGGEKYQCGVRSAVEPQRAGSPGAAAAYLKLACCTLHVARCTETAP